ncbi:P2X purinoceptor 7-like [Rhipicephalus sanguineus]|uniref:P2X purinoceptor 7-like n=1 Tax=Rhipicephalus sanguineus TaxID=34632 RepID=UPI0020C5A378|nr:P2X purinoceptor 7-like [Rhipicephalus sanguineus]
MSATDSAASDTDSVSELSDSCDSETYDTVDSPFLFDPPPRRPVAERQALALQYRDEGCTCGECRPAHRDENVCCRQVPAVRGLMNGLGSNCITHHTLFPLLCLVGDLLEINRRQLEFYNPTYLEHADRNRALRYTAYRLFVWWVWGRLGRGNRQPLPGCVLHRIRSTFPSANYELFSWV